MISYGWRQRNGVMIYQYPYTDSSQLTHKNLLKARDTMLKYNVPHETSRLYMGTQYTDLVYPECSNTANYNETISGIEMRGMFVFKATDIIKEIENYVPSIIKNCKESLKNSKA